MLLFFYFFEVVIPGFSASLKPASGERTVQLAIVFGKFILFFFLLLSALPRQKRTRKDFWYYVPPMFSDLYVYLIYNIFKMCFDLNTYIMKCLSEPISSRQTGYFRLA